MHYYIKDFFVFTSNSKLFEGKKVLEVGSRNVNGTLRRIIENFKPEKYLGIDIIEGKGVDKVCNANELINEFGSNSFDVVICTELLEHVRDWKNVITNIKGVVKPDGLLFITTRSKGFGHHGYPYDYWRYEIKDFQIIFSDFEILCLAQDVGSPGVLFWGKKPHDFRETDLKTYKLWSIIKRIRSNSISKFPIYFFLKILPMYKNILLPLFVDPLRKIFKSNYTVERRAK